MNSLSDALQVLNKMKEGQETEQMKELSDDLSKAITQQFVVLHRMRKFMDTVFSNIFLYVFLDGT